ncbi:MAG: trypsin-like serine protease [Rubripirellula sp.]
MTKRLLGLCALMFLYSYQSTHAQEQFPRILERILQGEETTDYNSVGIVGSQSRGGFCSGTLISSTHVLTAAHCAEVIEGATEGTFALGGQVYQTEAVLIHPDYNSRNLANDVAVLRLSEPVLGVVPSEIFRGTPVVGDVLFIVGFGGSGTADDGSDGSFGTKRVGVTTIDEVTDTMVNWNFDDPSEANTASGDSGGPGYLDIEGELFIASITSGGTIQDSSLGDFAFNTRVDAFADWIDAAVATIPAVPTEPEDDLESDHDCFWGKPFPFLQFLIDLLTALFEDLQAAAEQSDDSIAEAPASETPEQVPATEVVESAPSEVFEDTTDSASDVIAATSTVEPIPSKVLHRMRAASEPIRATSRSPRKQKRAVRVGAASRQRSSIRRSTGRTR